jgi:hypothetical protein
LTSTQFPESSNPESESNLDLPKTLQLIQTWVSQPVIDIRELDFTWLDQGEVQARIKIDQFKHEADSDGYQWLGFRVSDLTGQSTPTQNVQLVWEKDALTLDRIEALPDIAMEGVVLNWKNDFKAEGLLHFLKARLNIRIHDSITIQLTDGDIDSQELVKRFKLDLPGSFILSGLDAHILGWHQQPADWQIKGSLRLDSAWYEDYQLTNTTLQLEQKDQSFSLQLGAALDSNPIKISTHGKWTKPTEERWWAFTNASYSISTAKLGSLGNRWEDRPQGLDLSNALSTCFRSEGRRP